MRIVQRGSERTITGKEVLLTSDLGLQCATIRVALLQFSFGKPLSESQNHKDDLNYAEAIRRWKAGDRVLNTNWFETRAKGKEFLVYYKGADRLADGAHMSVSAGWE